MIPCFFDNRWGTIFDPFTWGPFKDFSFPSSNSLVSHENSAFPNIHIDWKETPEAHVFNADLPGLKKEQVRVEIKDGKVLQISRERNVEKEDKNKTRHRVERSSRRNRGENEVLAVTVPKEDVKKPDIKAIEISGWMGLYLLLIFIRILIQESGAWLNAQILC